MGAMERLQTVVSNLTEAELAQLVAVAEKMEEQHAQCANRNRMQEALALFIRHRGAYRGGFDREALHER